MKQKILLTLFGILFLNLAFGQTGKVIEPSLNKELVAILDTIHQDDQKYREESQVLEKKYGWDSKEVKDVWKTINAVDSINLNKVEKNGYIEIKGKMWKRLKEISDKAKRL